MAESKADRAESKADRLQRQYADRIADAIGPRDGTAPIPEPAPAGPDKYAGRTRDGSIEIGRLIADPDQPRKEFDQAEIEAMAATMRTHGQLQPIRVRWSQALGMWVIIEGERRFRAAKLAGLARMKCDYVEAELPPDAILEEQLIANCMREDLKPIEQAQAFRKLMELKAWGAAQLADRLQLHRATIHRALQLLELPEPIQAGIIAGTIAPSTGNELAKLGDPEEQAEVAEKVVAGKLSRAEAAAEVKSKKKPKGKPAKQKPKTVRIKTAGGFTVTVESRRPLADDDVLAALREAIEHRERMRAA